MATTGTVHCRIDVSRVLSVGVENYSTGSPLRGSVGDVRSLTSDTTPDADDGIAVRSALVAGAKTIDLTAVVDVNGATTTLTGLVPRGIIFRNRGAAAMTFAKGASNGLDSMAGSWSMELNAGERRCCDFIDVAAVAAIGSSNKTIDVTGTGTDAFDIALLVG